VELKRLGADREAADAAQDSPERELVEDNQVLLSDNITLHDENKMLLEENRQLLLRLRDAQEQLEAAAARGPGGVEDEEVRLELVLDMHMQDVAREGEEAFKEAVALDVAAAAGGDASKVRVLGLQAGSVRVEMALDEGVCGAGVRAVDVATALQEQAADPTSRLRQGRLTRATTAAKVHVVRAAAGDKAAAASQQTDARKAEQLQAEKVALEAELEAAAASIRRNAEIANEQDELIREWYVRVCVCVCVCLCVCLYL